MRLFMAAFSVSLWLSGDIQFCVGQSCDRWLDRWSDQTNGQIASKTRAEDMSVFFGFNQTIGCIGQWDITAVINQLCNVAKVVTDELTKRFVAL